METLSIVGRNLRHARKQRFPQDDLQAFAMRIGVSRATLQKMEKGDLSVGLGKYLSAAAVLDLEGTFNDVFKVEASLFDD